MLGWPSGYPEGGRALPGACAKGRIRVKGAHEGRGRAGAMRAIWRAVESAAGTWLKSNGASPPRERLTQEQSRNGSSNVRHLWSLPGFATRTPESLIYAVSPGGGRTSETATCTGRSLAGATLRGPISKARTFGMRTFWHLKPMCGNQPRMGLRFGLSGESHLRPTPWGKTEIPKDAKYLELSGGIDPDIHSIQSNPGLLSGCSEGL